MMGIYKIRLSAMCLGLLHFISCKSSMNECELFLSDSIRNKQIDSIAVFSNNLPLFEQNIIDKKKLHIDFGDLGSTDGILRIDLFKNGAKYCHTFLYFTNGHILHNRYVVLDSAGICRISINPKQFP
jgi:hypothetical protein